MMKLVKRSKIFLHPLLLDLADPPIRRYGEDWIKYKKLVPYRIIPYVY